jgi:tetratricopeptide (TPR) repeat protein
LFHLERGRRDEAIADLRRSADRGSAIAMGHLAQLFVEDARRDDALAWGRRAAHTAPMSMFARRAHGIAALAAGHRDEAQQAFAAALLLDRSAANQFQIASAMEKLGHPELAIPHFEACVADPELGPRARAALATLRGAR